METPLSTYRLQFNSAFRFADARRTLDYLKTLGVTHIYASPVSKARPGSLHGYDVVDHNEINPELGTMEEFRELLNEARKRSMGWVQDIVANHMAYDGDNRMLTDIFEKGQNSRYFNFFDIEWEHPFEGIRGKVLAPFLGRFYGEALEAGEIKLCYGLEGFTASYYGFRLPLRIESYVGPLTHGLRRLRERLGRDHPDFVKLLGLSYVLKNLPSTSEFDELYDQVQFIKRLLWELYARNPDIKGFIEKNLAEYNGSPGDPESFNLLDRLLSDQLFRLSFWKVAAEEINYRRFFNINELITLKAEEDEVFDAVHTLVLKLLRQGSVTGLRIDHIDGFYAPLHYLRKLREAGATYIIAEKILGYDEELPASWPVDGTTGYDFLNHVNAVFCDSSNEARFTRAYTNFIRSKPSYKDLVYEKKKLITELDMRSDAANIARLLKITLSKDRYGSDITLSGLRRAITEVMASFPVYRTYISSGAVDEADSRCIRDAVEEALRRNPALVNEIRFMEKVLTLDYRDYFTEEEKREWLHFVMRFQQFTGPLMAKGFEDTLLYVYNRLLSLNEVGGDPGRFGMAIQGFHTFNKKRSARSPFTLNATSTHDTKRGEDSRARINVLSEMPEEWERNLRKWYIINRSKKMDPIAPDRNDEYFLYQTLIGAFPHDPSDYASFVDRIKAYIIKAVREAKIHTAWLKPDTAYEEGFISFIDAILKDSEENRFLPEFIPFQRKAAWYGVFNSLSQALLKIASPGVPDFYQGTELWDLTLVDPDNRRPVDHAKRAALLDHIIEREKAGPASLARELLEDLTDGKVKLFLIYRALKARNAQAHIFTEGGYNVLHVRGAHRTSVISFARGDNDGQAIAIAPRFLSYIVKEGQLPIGEVWGDTEVVLPENFPMSWVDAVTGEQHYLNGSIPLKDALWHFPAALLLSAPK